MRGLIGSLRPRLGRIAGIVVSLLVIAGFAFVLSQIAGGPIAHSIVGDDPTATSSAFAYQTPTSTPLNAPLTATYYLPGNATATPVQRNIPFSVDLAEGDVSCTVCATKNVTWRHNETRICDAQEPFEGDAHFHVIDGAPGGTATYRWISDLGPVTPTLSIKLGPGDGPIIDPAPNSVTDNWTTSSALGNGARHWVQLEVLTPNHILSSQEWFELVCQTQLKGGASVVPGTVNYDCSGLDAQTFTFNASVELWPGPPTFTISYHWLRSDGSVSPTYTDAIPGGVDTFALHSDSITVTASQLSPRTFYTDTLVSDSSALPNPNGVGGIAMPC